MTRFLHGIFIVSTFVGAGAVANYIQGDSLLNSMNVIAGISCAWGYFAAAVLFDKEKTL
jgi:hypothetical protein